MTLTEKVRMDMGRYEYKLFALTALTSGSHTISMGALEMNYVQAGIIYPVTCTVSAGTTTMPCLKVYESSAGGTDLTLSGVTSTGDALMLEVWGW